MKRQPKTTARWRAVLGALGVCTAVAPSTAGATDGEFTYGLATPVDIAVAPRFAQLSFEFERCGSFVRTSWYDAAHTLLAADELEAPGNRLTRYHFWRPNVDDWATVTRSGAVLLIVRQAGGKRRSAEVAAADTVVAGPMLLLIAERELPQLQAGLQLKFHYAVPEQFDTYEFTLGRSASAATASRDVQIRAASWLLRQWVRPLELHFDRDGRISGLRGRVLPVMGTATREEPLDVEAQVLRRERRPCSAQARPEAAYGYLSPPH